MKLFTKSEMQALESASAAQGVPLSQLMEAAGEALAQEVKKRCPSLSRAVLLCGKGNNGGDGFVCARLLARAGVSCTVILVQGPPTASLAREAFDKMPGQVAVIDESGGPARVKEALAFGDAILDCVFGFGFCGQLPPDIAALFAYVNSLPGFRLSGDLPSGVECDTGRAAACSFRAQATVAFTAGKPAHWCYPAKEYCGQVVIRQVGVPQALLDASGTQAALADNSLAKQALRPLNPQANKGTHGRLLLVAGSYGMAGACVMAARGALRCGVGLLDIFAEKAVYPILAAAAPEAVFTVYDASDPGSLRQKLEKALDLSTACAMGCGLGELAQTVCPPVLEACRVPLLLDADALNFCARSGFPLRTLSQPLVLTPHPGEMARLTGRSISDIQAGRIEAALSYAESAGAVVLLKGAGTVIASPQGRLTINPTGNPGMAKGGSGDVLAGVAGALLAQGIPAYEAAAAGAYLHGLAGDLCQEKLSARSMLPTDLIQALPEICKNFERQ